MSIFCSTIAPPLLCILITCNPSIEHLPHVSTRVRRHESIFGGLEFPFRFLFLIGYATAICSVKEIRSLFTSSSSLKSQRQIGVTPTLSRREDHNAIMGKGTLVERKGIRQS